MPLHYYIWYSVRRLKYHRSLSLFATHQLKLSIWRGGGVILPAFFFLRFRAGMSSVS